MTRAVDGLRHDPNAVTADGPRRAQVECPGCGRYGDADARFCAGCGFRFGEDEHVDGEADPLLGRTIADRYRIEGLLGRGGMGVVYRVEHVRMGKIMAMKLLSGALAREKEVVKRFKREAEAVSRLDHPNTVQVFDFGQSQGMTYLVMELLTGRDLGQLVKEDGPQPFARVARFATQVCGSVQQAHELGIVHRDLKPENVMVLEDRSVRDFVKVLDFGLAKLRDTEEAGELSITRAGSILGTPYYMAPETIRGEDADGRSDVYAVGALMYKVLVGVPPFWASSPVGVLTMHLTEDVLAPSVKRPDLDIPPDADRILLSALAKDPDDRYQSMAELRADLLAWLEERGDADGLDSGRVMPSGAAPAASPSGRRQLVATRGDVDRYERSLRRRSAIQALLGVLVVGLGIGAGVWAWTQRAPEVPVAESEPNDALTEADPLPEGRRFTAYLGARFDETRSDADWYVLRSPRRDRRVLRIEVGGIPNMDLVVELYREGGRDPLLVADGGGMGAGEVIANFPVEGPDHYVRVRELWESGRYPTENVSDPYSIVWRVVEPAEGEEREINDSIALAQEVRVGDAVRGWIGWGGDQDAYCFDGEGRVRARLEPVEDLDLVIEQRSRTTGRNVRVDAGGAGEAEVTPLTGGAPCWLISAQGREGGRASDADHPYVLHVEAE